jgi:mucin-2
MRISILIDKIKIVFVIFLLFSSLFSAFAQCPTITNLNQSFCDSQNPTIGSLGFIDNGGGISWYNSPTSTVALSNSLQLLSGIYYADDATGTCGSRQSVTVTMYNAPGTSVSSIGICVISNSNEAIVNSLAISGNNIKWYTTPTGGIPLLSTATVFDNTFYYASQTNPNTGCETYRTPILVNVKFRPPPPNGATNQIICNDPNSPPTLASIVASNVYHWYLTPTLGAFLPLTTPLVNGQTYYADSYVDPCPSATRLPVTVTLSQPNNAGIDATKRICENQVASTLPFSLFSELGGTPQSTGTWSGPIATIDGNLGTIDVSSFTADGSPYVFTYSVANGACPLDDAKVTIFVAPTPIASFSLDVSQVCSQSAASLIFTGTPNAIVTYTENGIVKTVVIEPDGATIVSQNFTANTVFLLTNVTFNGAISCSNIINSQLNLNVLPLPEVVLTKLDSQPICIGENATLIFTGTPGATVIFHVGSNPNQSIIIEPDGTTSLVLSFTVTTVVTLVSVSSNNSLFCIKQLSDNITVLVTPLPIATIQLPIINPVCAEQTSIITFNGTPNAIVTYLINGGSPQTITLNNSGTNTISGNYTINTTFTLVSIVTSGINPCLNVLTGDFTLIVKELPTATVNPLQQIACSGDSRLIVFTGTPNAIITYTINGVAASITLNSLGVAQTINPYNVTTVIQLISVTATGTTDCTKLLNNTATIVVTPRIEAGVSTSKSVCSNDGIQNLFALLGSTAQVGGTWTTPSGTIGNGFYNPLIDPVGTYTYSVIGIAPCPNDFATVTITLSPAPNAGIGGAFPFCSNSNVVDLFSLLTGNPQVGGTWSPTLASGTSIFNPAIDVSGSYTYTIVGSGSCTNAQSTLIINVTNGPNAGTNGVAEFCSNSSPANLFSSLGGNPTTGGIWTPTLIGGVYNPVINNPGVYTYSFSGSGICQTDSATVTVNENPVPSAGTNGTKLFCSNDTPTDLFLSLGGTPQTGGTWSPALVSGSGIFDPLLDTQGIYTYTVGGVLCVQPTAQVTVTVLQSPNAGGTGASLLILACKNLTSIDLFSGLNGTQDVGVWTDESNVIVSNIINPSLLSLGIHEYTYTVSGGISPCNSNSSIVKVEVQPIPNAGTFFAIAPICNIGGTLDLFTLLAGNQLGGIWENETNQIVPNILDLSTLQPGIHVYSYSIINSCIPPDKEFVQFTLYATPVLDSANIDVVSPNCQDQDLTFNFTNMMNGSYTITLGISGSNTASNQVIPLNVVAGSGNFTLSNTFYPNVGNTIFTFSNLINTVTNCSVNPANITKTVLINSISDLADTNLSAVTKCFGEDIVVAIAGATTLPDGNYQFTYEVSNGINPPATGTSLLNAITGGAGSFIIQASNFPVFGNYTIKITQILNLTTGCNNLAETAMTTVILKNSPNPTGALVSIPPSCINTENTVTISNATNLIGTYTLNYQLTTSGNPLLSATIPVTFVGGVGSFVIPKPILTVSGTVTFTILDLIDQVTMCGLIGTSFPTVVFNVYGLDTPIITPVGYQFCDRDTPTIANLNSNINGTDPVIWYDSATLGSIYPTTTLLQNGATYYATFTNATGCESTPRLAVTVDLSFCDELLIPDGFSPNDDTVNDEFVIKNLPLKFPNFKLEIYNRYGNSVYSGNANTPNWNGTTTEKGIKVGNEKLPVGVYFYVLDFNDGLKKPKQGRVYLSR